jgi:hypothetical protein
MDPGRDKVLLSGKPMALSEELRRWALILGSVLAELGAVVPSGDAGKDLSSLRGFNPWGSGGTTVSETGAGEGSSIS